VLALAQSLWGCYRRFDQTQPLPLELEVRAPAVHRLLYGGSIELAGTLSARGIARSVGVTGCVRLCALGPGLGYQLEFRGDDGGAYCLELEMELDFRRPLLSASTLAGSLRTLPATRLAEVELRYDYRRDYRSLFRWE
jgi:hypothetical protein